MKQIAPDQPLARGRTADVYDWDENHILKLFHNWYGLGNIEYERKMARAVHASGVKSPAVGDLIQVEGRYGLIYERVEGKSMLEMFQQKPWMAFRYARILAGLHAQMHGCAFDADIPSQRDQLRFKIERADALPASLKTVLWNALGSLPEGDRVCHGDFHPANVLMNGDHATVIDWIDASRGNPLADVARTSIIFLGAVSSSQVRNPVSRIFLRVFHSVYLKQYFYLCPGGKNEYRLWLPIVAAARLSENMPELEKWLVQQTQMVK